MSETGGRRKLGTMVTAVGIALILAAVGLTVFNLWDESRAGREAEQALAGILDQLEREEAAETTEPMEPEEEPAPELGWSDEAEMPAVELDGEAYLGILEIPAIQLTLPVRDSWSYPNLRKTPCRYSGGLYSQDMVIAGHNYDSHFGRLDELKSGDQVFFTDMDRNQMVYLVAETETLPPTAIEEMTTPGAWALTLFTCTIGGRSRVTVRCVLQPELFQT